MKWLRLRAAGSKRKHRRQSIASRSGANNPCPGEAVRFATVHYLAGRRDLRWVSNLQTSQLTAEADLVKLDGLRQMNRITLLLALGGSSRRRRRQSCGRLGEHGTIAVPVAADVP